MLIDSHCHLDRLDLSAHGGSLDAALAAARARGVGHFLCIGISADNAAAVKALSERYADVDCTVGVHPLDLQPGRRLGWIGCWPSSITPMWWPLAKPVWTITTSRKRPSCSARLFVCICTPRNSPASR